jgi:hypothetical protein
VAVCTRGYEEDDAAEAIRALGALAVELAGAAELEPTAAATQP